MQRGFDIKGFLLLSQNKDEDEGWSSGRPSGHALRTAVVYKFRYSGCMQER
jgi:hypothetical protein